MFYIGRRALPRLLNRRCLRGTSIERTTLMVKNKGSKAAVEGDLMLEIVIWVTSRIFVLISTMDGIRLLKAFGVSTMFLISIMWEIEDVVVVGGDVLASRTMQHAAK